MNLELYQTIFEKASMGFAYCEVILNDKQEIIDLNFIKVNDKFKEILHINNLEINNTKQSEIFKNKKIDQELVDILKQVLKRQDNTTFDYHSELLNRHLRIEIHLIENNHVLIFLTDITDSINETIEKSILIKTTNDIILELDENYTFTSIYTNYEESLFVNRESIIHQNISDIFHGEISTKLINAFTQAKATNDRQTIIYKSIENHVEKFYQATIFYVKFDHEYRYVISIRDITKQKKTENRLIEINNRLTEITKQSRTVIWEVDPEGRYTYINAVCKDVFGYDPEEMIGQYFYHFYPEENRLKFKEEVLNLMRKHEVVSNYESPYLTKNKEKIWLVSFSAPKYSEDGEFLGYRGSDADITEKHNIQQAQIKGEEKYRFITENASDLIWIVNLNDYRFTYISPAITRLRGISIEEAMAQRLDESVSPESWELVKDEIERTFGEFILDPEHAKNHILTIEQTHRDGHKIWVEISVRYRFNELNQIEVIGISRDVTERKKIDDEIRFLSFHDQLTGLYNRRYYEVELNRLDTQRNLPLSFITVDVNGLKMTNDVFGHNMGDELIKLAAKALKEGCREDDIIARVGGDEFLILLPKTSREDCEIIVSRIYTKIEMMNDKPNLLSMSLGLATKDTIDQEVSDIVKYADQALYQRKLIESETYKRQLLGKVMNRLYKIDTDLRRHLKSLIQLVTQFSIFLDFNENEIKQLKLAAMYHDIGKIGIDEKDIYLYQTNRVEYEYLLKRQPELSYQILRYIPEYVEIANIVLAYHENYDGSGYPRGLSKNEISRDAMIIHIVNDYDKLRHNVGLSQADSIERLLAKKGNELEPALVDSFCQMLKATKL